MVEKAEQKTVRKKVPVKEVPKIRLSLQGETWTFNKYVTITEQDSVFVVSTDEVGEEVIETDVEGTD